MVNIYNVGPIKKPDSMIIVRSTTSGKIKRGKNNDQHRGGQQQKQQFDQNLEKEVAELVEKKIPSQEQSVPIEKVDSSPIVDPVTGQILKLQK